MNAIYATIDDVKYVTFDETAGEALKALVAANGTDELKAQIVNALLVASQTKDGLLFEIASRSNEEFAVKYAGVSLEQARAATATLRTRWQIQAIQPAIIAVAL